VIRYLLLTLLLFSNHLLAATAGEETAEAVKQVEGAVGVGDVFQVLVALLFVVMLIIVTAWFFRRFSGVTFSRNGALKLLAGISVGQRERIVLVQAGEVQLLLGVSPGNVRTLHVFEKPVLLDSNPEKGAERFAERLMSAMNSSKEGQS
jgi:flagellar protein FliO/FliZ